MLSNVIKKSSRYLRSFLSYSERLRGGIRHFPRQRRATEALAGETWAKRAVDRARGLRFGDRFRGAQDMKWETRESTGKRQSA